MIPGIDPSTGALILPLWLAAVIAALLAAFGVFLLGRVGRDGIVETLSRAGLVLVGAAVAAILVSGNSGDGVAAQRRALDARLADITARAVMPASPLACLNGTAGEAVEAACEKALFASPESAAAAVTYVAAQLSLLADGAEFERRSGTSYESALSGLHRALETDRFGIVAQVLAVRDACTFDHCGSLALLHDANQVSENLITRKYESLIGRHAADWPANGGTPVAATGAPASSAVAATSTPAGSPRKPNNLFFPSSASIPAVSIMAPEPAPPQTNASAGGSPSGAAAAAAVPAGGSADAAAKPSNAPSARKPPASATQQTRRPTTPPAPGAAPTGAAITLAPPTTPPLGAAPAPGQASND
jgi:hypothetical protein